MVRKQVEVEVRKGNEKLTWTVQDNVKKLSVPEMVEFNKQLGIYRFDFNHQPICSN